MANRVGSSGSFCTNQLLTIARYLLPAAATKTRRDGVHAGPVVHLWSIRTGLRRPGTADGVIGAV